MVPHSKFVIARNESPSQTSSSNMSLRYPSPSMTSEYPPQKYSPQKSLPQKYPPQKSLPQKYPPQIFHPQKYPPQKYPPQKYLDNETMFREKTLILVGNICFENT